MKGRPEKGEAAAEYFRYIDRVPEGDVLARLEAQLDEMMAFLGDVSEEKSLHRYAPEKWSIRQVLSHVTDGERLFLFRAFWFARGLDIALPSYDEDRRASPPRRTASRGPATSRTSARRASPP
jgi:hypothetical protein